MCTHVLDSGYTSSLASLLRKRSDEVECQGARILHLRTCVRTCTVRDLARSFAASDRPLPTSCRLGRSKDDSPYSELGDRSFRKVKEDVRSVRVIKASCAPIRYTNIYGMDTSDRTELVAHWRRYSPLGSLNGFACPSTRSGDV
jgi:hypothetical protein